MGAGPSVPSCKGGEEQLFTAPPMIPHFVRSRWSNAKRLPDAIPTFTLRLPYASQCPCDLRGHGGVIQQQGHVGAQ